MSRMSSGEPSGVSPLQEINGVTTRRRFFKSATRYSLRSVGSTNGHAGGRCVVVRRQRFGERSGTPLGDQPDGLTRSSFTIGSDRAMVRRRPRGRHFPQGDFSGGRSDILRLDL